MVEGVFVQVGEEFNTLGVRFAGADDAGVAADTGQLAVMALIARDILANAAQEQAHVFRAAMMHRYGFSGPETMQQRIAGRALAA